MDITLFDGFTNPDVTGFEQGAMIAVVVVAILGLLYAWFLTRQIMSKSTGNEKMQKIAKAIRDGGNAYLKRQFKTIALLIVILGTDSGRPARIVACRLGTWPVPAATTCPMKT